MSERWEKIIEHELDFLYYAPEYIADLNDRLRENEMNIQYPVTQFDSIQGRVYLACPGTEEQAIRRILTREKIESAIKRLARRADRLKNALKQLNEDEQDLIVWFYLERDSTEQYMARALGFSSIKELRIARKEILCKLLKIYESDRTETITKFNKLQVEWRKEIISHFKSVRKLKNVN